MMRERFTAGVQYNDFKGTFAADDADQTSLSRLLHQRGLMSDDEFLVGARVWIGENHGGEVSEPSISAIVISAADFEAAKRELDKGEPIQARRIELELGLNEFLGLFKRMEFVMTKRDLKLDGREYQYPE